MLMLILVKLHMERLSPFHCWNPQWISVIQLKMLSISINQLIFQSKRVCVLLPLNLSMLRSQEPWASSLYQEMTIIMERFFRLMMVMEGVYISQFCLFPMIPITNYQTYIHIKYQLKKFKSFISKCLSRSIRLIKFSSHTICQHQVEITIFSSEIFNPYILKSRIISNLSPFMQLLFVIFVQKMIVYLRTNIVIFKWIHINRTLEV